MRIFPEICPRMTCPFSSFTRKVALGRVSMISPCIWITSSLAILPLALEAALLEQALVLVRHDVSLHLRHEVHGHDDDDQQGRSAEIERHVPPEDQKLRQQAYQGHVYGSRQGQSQEYLLKVLGSLHA